MKRLIRQFKFLLTYDTKFNGLKRIVQENYWANIFNSTIKGNDWFDEIGLSPGRWAVGFPILYLVFKILNEIKPDYIIEFGLGELTKMIQAYKKNYNKYSFCLTVEHDQEWIELKKKQFLDMSLINILKCQLEELVVSNKYNSLVYKDLEAELDMIDKRLKFNLIIIDGPFGSKHYSRYNIINLIEKGKLHEDFIIIMDDYERTGEKQTANVIFSKLEMMNIEYKFGKFSGAKDVLIITSHSLHHYTTI